MLEISKKDTSTSDQMASTPLFLILIFSLSCFVASQTPSSIQSKCANEVTKVMACLQFATAKAEKPSEECCTAAKSMKSSNPVCMCYIIGEVHQGAPTLKDMGLQVDRLLQLPSQCSIPNATVSDCPSLLNLPKNSPEYSFFVTTNSSKSPSSSTPQSASQESGKSGANPAAGSALMALGGLMAIVVAAIVLEVPLV